MADYLDRVVPDSMLRPLPDARSGFVSAVRVFAVTVIAARPAQAKGHHGRVTWLLIRSACGAASMSLIGGGMKHDSHRQVYRRGHAQAHFPALNPDEAVAVVTVLERVIRGIWRAHGDAMADFLGRVDPDSELMVRPYDAQWCGVEAREPGSDEDDF